MPETPDEEGAVGGDSVIHSPESRLSSLGALSSAVQDGDLLMLHQLLQSQVRWLQVEMEI